MSTTGLAAIEKIYKTNTKSSGYYKPDSWLDGAAGGAGLGALGAGALGVRDGMGRLGMSRGTDQAKFNELQNLIQARESKLNAAPPNSLVPTSVYDKINKLKSKANAHSGVGFFGNAGSFRRGAFHNMGRLASKRLPWLAGGGLLAGGMLDGMRDKYASEPVPALGALEMMNIKEAGIGETIQKMLGIYEPPMEDSIGTGGAIGAGAGVLGGLGLGGYGKHLDKVIDETKYNLHDWGNVQKLHGTNAANQGSAGAALQEALGGIKDVSTEDSGDVRKVLEEAVANRTNTTGGNMAKAVDLHGNPTELNLDINKNTLQGLIEQGEGKLDKLTKRRGKLPKLGKGMGMLGLLGMGAGAAAGAGSHEYKYGDKMDWAKDLV